MIDHRPHARNRSYFDHPLQGNGRGAHDYGRTGRIVEPRSIDLTWIGLFTCVAALAFVGAALAGWLPWVTGR